MLSGRVKFWIEGCTGIAIVRDADGRSIDGVVSRYSEAASETATRVDHEGDLCPPEASDAFLLLSLGISLAFRNLAYPGEALRLPHDAGPRDFVLEGFHDFWRLPLPPDLLIVRMS